jgi:hypothetical protein
MTSGALRSTSPRARFTVASGLILCLALWVRLTHLYSQPVFIDEANHLAWSQNFAAGEATAYPLFLDGKLLMGALIAALGPNGPAPLWIGRVAIGLVSTLSVAACLATGALLGSRKAGALAGLLYALLPQAVIHERQILADALMSAFGALAILFTLHVARSRRPIWPMLQQAAWLSAAFSAKFTGAIYVIFPLLAILWFGRAKRHLGALGLAALMTAIFFGALYPRWGVNDQRLVGQQVGFLHCPPLACEGDLGAQIENLGSAVRTLLDLVPAYLGPALVALGLAVLVVRREHRRTVYLAAGSAGMLLAFLPFAGDIPPRYAVFVAAPVAILGARGLLVAGRNSLVGAIALALLCLWPMAQTGIIIVNPAKADLANLDRQSYDNGAMAAGLEQATRVILAREAGATVPPVVLLKDVHFPSAAAYFDPTRVDVRRLADTFPADLGGWLVNGQHVYILADTAMDEELATPGMTTQEIGRYPSIEARVVRVRVVAGATGQTLDAIYRQLFIDPSKLARDYQALADSLDPTERLTLLVYPPHQLEELSPLVSRANVDLYALGGSWPLALSQDDEARLLEAPAINAVFLEETKGDPQRRLETWLKSQFFYVDEQWFGPIRMMRLAGRGEVGQRIEVGAQFGEAIVLESIEVLDARARAGGVARVRLNWQAQASVEHDLKVFTHLLAGEAIAAQHDGQPVGELRPTSTWQAGERIVDQFAIRLPPDLRAGEYQMRIGMYDPETGARLTVTLQDGAAGLLTTGEFYEGGHIVVSN